MAAMLGDMVARDDGMDKQQDARCNQPSETARGLHIYCCITPEGEELRVLGWRSRIVHGVGITSPCWVAIDTPLAARVWLYIQLYFTIVCGSTTKMKKIANRN